MRATSKLLALALAALVQPAFAAPEPVVIDFEAIEVDPNAVGVSLASSNPYAGLGVSFTGGAWGVRSIGGSCGGFSAFVPVNNAGCGALLLATDPNAPNDEEPVFDTIVIAAANQGPSFTLNFGEGFVTGSSFSYKALLGSNIVIELFSGLDGKGSLGFVKASESECKSNPSATFCDWESLKLDFSGVAKSMVVSGADEVIMLDNFSLQRQEATVPGQLPEPASLALALSALGVLGWSRKRASAR